MPELEILQFICDNWENFNKGKFVLYKSGRKFNIYYFCFNFNSFYVYIWVKIFHSGRLKYDFLVIDPDKNNIPHINRILVRDSDGINGQMFSMTNLKGDPHLDCIKKRLWEGFYSNDKKNVYEYISGMLSVMYQYASTHLDAFESFLNFMRIPTGRFQGGLEISVPMGGKVRR